MKLSDDNLIFLISLPRSGSTLLQHILACHSKIAATAEPWILFPAAYALRVGGLTADYDAHVGQIALSEFLKQLDGGEEEYYTAVRKMALHLYDAYLAKQNVEMFLDKTSRYYLILPELVRIFPQSKYILLLRNPLAVLASYLDSMVSGELFGLNRPGIRNDLLDGYRLMLQGIQHFGDNAIVVKYEDLVEQPEVVIMQLSKQLGIQFESAMLNYGQSIGVLPGKLVDPKSIHKHEGPVKDYVNAWRTRFISAQEKYTARAFLNYLGPELINSLGYSYQDLLFAVSFEDKGWAPVVSWKDLMTPREHRSRLQWCKIVAAYIWHSWQKEVRDSSTAKSSTHIRLFRFANSILSRAARKFS